MPTVRYASPYLSLLPGVALCAAVSGLAFGIQRAERLLFGSVWVETLVLAILIGTAIRTAWAPDHRWSRGIGFSAKTLLEIAVALLGASVSARTILAAGSGLLVAIMFVVAVTLGTSFLIGRMLRLPPRMALLVACGNSICGNSAIAAVAPVIDAESKDIAASIGFTAILGVLVVLVLPLLGHALRLDALEYGAFAGLTVYAVPQVVAAAAPAGSAAVQMGTLVKLVRVLMLGPVCLLLSLVAPRLGNASEQVCSPATSDHGPAPVRPTVGQLVPWFIIGFMALLGLRSLDVIPHALLAPTAEAATMLTVVSMAALGLEVDIRSVADASGRVTAAVLLSLLVLGSISFAVIHALQLA